MKNYIRFTVRNFSKNRPNARRRRMTESEWFFEIVPPRPGDYGTGIYTLSTPIDENGKFHRENTIRTDMRYAKTKDIHRLADLWVSSYFRAIHSITNKIVLSDDFSD